MLEVMVVRGSAEDVVHYFRKVKIGKGKIAIPQAEPKSNGEGKRAKHQRKGKYARLFKGWTKEEDKQLLARMLPRKGYSHKQRRRRLNRICIELKRSKRAVVQRHTMLKKQQDKVPAN